MFEFLEPNILYFIIPIIGFVFFLYLKKKNTKKFIGYGDLKNIYKKSSFFYNFYYILISVIFITSLFIIAQPIEKNTEEKIKKNGIDIMLLLDVSYSMIAEDLQPNRLSAAKEIIDKFLDKLQNDRVGFVVFAGKPFTSLPLNFDYNISKKILSNITVDTINQRVGSLQGTAIGDGLIFAADNFDDDSREKVIILLTDGTANKGVEPDIAVQYLNEKYQENNKIKIYAIGIGKDEKTFINIQNQLGFSQKLEIGGLDEESLEFIAKASNGKYFRAEDKETLNKIFEEITQLEKTDIEVESIEDIKPQSKYFIYFLSVILVLFLIIKSRKHIYNR